MKFMKGLIPNMRLMFFVFVIVCLALATNVRSTYVSWDCNTGLDCEWSDYCSEYGMFMWEPLSERSYTFSSQTTGSHTCTVTAVTSSFGFRNGNVQTDEKTEFWINGEYIGITDDLYCNSEAETCRDCRHVTSTMTNNDVVLSGSNTIVFKSYESHTLIRLTVSCSENIVNNPPNINSIAITPPSPDENDDLTCTVTTADTDGNLERLDFKWYVNTQLVRSQSQSVSGYTATKYDSLSSMYTHAGDTVKCEAIVYDTLGADDMDYTTTTILPTPNNPPWVQLQTPANGATGVPIGSLLTWIGGDVDGDTVTYDVYFGTNSNPPYVTNTPNTYYIPSLTCDIQYYWKIIVKDGKGLTATSPIWTFRAEVCLPVNHPPDITYIKITPENPTDNQDLTCSVDVIDQDGDLNYVQFKWFVDGVLKRQINKNLYGSSDSEQDVLSQYYTEAGDIVKCEARAYDFQGAYDYDTDTVRVVPVVVNHPPSSDYVEITPRHPNTQQDLTCSGLFSDVDDNLDYVLFYWYVNNNQVRSASKDVQGSSDTAYDVLSYTYTSPGDVVKCKTVVYDTLGLYDSEFSQPVVISGYPPPPPPPPPNQKPVAILTANPTCPVYVKVGQNVYLSGSQSYDPDGSVIQHHFDFGDGSSSAWLPESYAYHSYSSTGTYYAKLKVKDNQYLESDWSSTVSICVIQDQPPCPFPPCPPPCSYPSCPPPPCPYPPCPPYYEEAPEVDYIEITPGDPYDYNTLACNAGVSDRDDDLDYVEFRWYVNNDFIRKATENVWGRYDHASTQLKPEYFAEDDVVKCKATVYDRTDRSDSDYDLVRIKKSYPPPPPPGICGVSITKLDYVSQVIEGENAWFDVTVKNTGDRTDPVTLRVYADNTFKTHYTLSFSPGTEYAKRFYLSLPVGYHTVRFDAYIACGASDTRSVTVHVTPRGIPPPPPPPPPPPEPRPLDICIMTSSSIDVMINTGKPIKVTMESPNRTVFNITVSGLPENWANYPRTVTVENERKSAYIYVVPKELGRYYFTITVSAPNKTVTEEVDMYVAPEEKVTEGEGLKGLSGMFLTMKSNWALALIILFLVLFIIVIYLAHRKFRKKEKYEYYQEKPLAPPSSYPPIYTT